MKPFQTREFGENIRLTFAYQYLSILKDEEDFHFIPIEGKDIIINKNTAEIKNLSEVFVFQRGNRFVRIPLYQLMLVSNVSEHLVPIIEKLMTLPKEENESAPMPKELESIAVAKEPQQPQEQYSENYIRIMIDEALDEKDKDKFTHWTNLLHTHLGGISC